MTLPSVAPTEEGAGKRVGSQVSGLADERIGSLEPVHVDHNPRGMNVEFLSQGTNPLFEGLRQTACINPLKQRANTNTDWYARRDSSQRSGRRDDDEPPRGSTTVL